MSVISNSPIRYFGSKAQLSKRIIELSPNHTTYVEVFGGGAHVLAAKLPAKRDVYNDIDKEVVNFLRQLKINATRLKQSVDELPTSRALFEVWKNSPLPADDFERATRWFYLLRQRIHASNATLKSGWRANKFKNLALDYHSSIKRFDDFSIRLQNVEICNQDFKEIIKTYDGPNTFFFLDPPYVDKEKYYQGGFTEETHIELANILKSIQGKALVTYYEHPLISELYNGWYSEIIETYTGSNVLKEGEQRKKKREIILMNYTPSTIK